MRNKKLVGTGVALVTPFNEDYSIDFESLDNLIDNLIQNGIDYFVIMGTTAESVTLSENEQKTILEYVKKKVNGRVPLVFGMGGNDTFDIVNKIKNTDFNGVEAILSVTPYYNKPSQEGLFHHYELIAKHSPVDILLYNVPSRTSINIQTSVVVNLAQKHSNIIGIKEASGDINQCMDLIMNCPKNFMIISGDDKCTFSILTLGGVGVISVQAMAFPRLFSNMVNNLLNLRLKEAKNNHYDLLKSVDLFYVEGNPSGIKEALYLKGICSSNQVRLPLRPLSKENSNKLKSVLKDTI